ncbi:hypothetical protein ACFLXC_02175 [Chloroflexota bacterium]
MKYTVKCNNCSADNIFFLADTSFTGYYQCWKCRTPFNICLQDKEVKSCRQLSLEEFEQQKKEKALRDKFKKTDD